MSKISRKMNIRRRKQAFEDRQHGFPGLVFGGDGATEAVFGAM